MELGGPRHGSLLTLYSHNSLVYNTVQDGNSLLPKLTFAYAWLQLIKPKFASMILGYKASCSVSPMCAVYNFATDNKQFQRE